MDKLNQKLAWGIWLTSFASIVLNAILYIMYPLAFGVVLIVTLLISLALQFLLGYNMYRGKNDTFTMVSIILIAIFNFNLAGFVAVAMRLILRKNRESEKIRNLWYIPVLVAAVLGVINLSGGISVITLVSVLISIVYYTIFSYWFIKYLK